METMNVTFDDLSAMAFEHSSHDFWTISLGLDLTYASSTITTQKPVEGEFDLLFEAMHDDYISGQPSAAPRTTPGAHAPQVLQTPTVTTTTTGTAPTPTNSSSQATNFLNTSQDVDKLETQQHIQHQPATIAENVPNDMFDENTFGSMYAKNDREDIGKLGAKVEGEFDLLFEAMHDDYISGQSSAAPRTTPGAHAPQVLQTPT
nr:hypothetical protein [Tanacetum cinerariifolium]